MSTDSKAISKSENTYIVLHKSIFCVRGYPKMSR